MCENRSDKGPKPPVYTGGSQLTLTISGEIVKGGFFPVPFISAKTEISAGIKNLQGC